MGTNWRSSTRVFSGHCAATGLGSPFADITPSHGAQARWGTAGSGPEIISSPGRIDEEVDREVQGGRTGTGADATGMCYREPLAVSSA